MVGTRSNNSKKAKLAIVKELDFGGLKSLASKVSAEHPSVVGKIRARSIKGLREALSKDACLMTCLTVVDGVLQVKAGLESAERASREFLAEQEATAAARKAAKSSKSKSKEKELQELRAQLKAQEQELQAKRGEVSELAMQQIAALVASQMQAQEGKQKGEQKGKVALSEGASASSEEDPLSTESEVEFTKFTEPPPAHVPKRRRGGDRWVDAPKPKRARRPETTKERKLRKRVEKREREREELCATLAAAGRSSAGASLAELRRRVVRLRNDEEKGSEEGYSSADDESDERRGGGKKERRQNIEFREMKVLLDEVLRKTEADEKLGRLKLPGNRKQFAFIEAQRARLVEMEKVLRTKPGKFRAPSEQEVATVRVLLDDVIEAMDQRAEDLMIAEMEGGWALVEAYREEQSVFEGNTAEVAEKEARLRRAQQKLSLGRTKAPWGGRKAARAKAEPSAALDPSSSVLCSHCFSPKHSTAACPSARGGGKAKGGTGKKKRLFAPRAGKGSRSAGY
jgi:hypothetical protein